MDIILYIHLTWYFIEFLLKTSWERERELSIVYKINGFAWTKFNWKRIRKLLKFDKAWISVKDDLYMVAQTHFKIKRGTQGNTTVQYWFGGQFLNLCWHCPDFRENLKDNTKLWSQLQILRTHHSYARI